MNTKVAKWSILGLIFFGLFFFILGLIMALPTYLLWNWLAPLFGLPILTIWQCLGLAFLCHILFSPKGNSFKDIQQSFKKLTKKDILND